MKVTDWISPSGTDSYRSTRECSAPSPSVLAFHLPEQRNSLVTCAFLTVWVRPRGLPPLRDDLFKHVAANVGETANAAGVMIGQIFIVEA